MPALLSLGEPDAQQLALVVPVVEGFRRGQTLVALKANQRCARHGGKGFRRGRLAHPRLALQQQRTTERDGQVDRRCGAEVEQVVLRVEASDHLVDVGERVHGWAFSPSTRIDLITSATMDTAISAGVFAPIGRPTGVCTLLRSVSVRSRALRIDPPRTRLATSPM